jgi:hypothetical protein
MLPVIAVSVVPEMVNEICIIPIFDMQFGGGVPFSY